MRRTFWVLHAWLLALLTPATGLPHRQCTCPDGGVKWFCLRFSSDGSCCCNSACCAARAPEEPAPRAHCCCCRQKESCAARTPEPGRGLRETPCRKTWLPSTVVSDRPTRDANPAKAPATVLLLAAIPTEMGWAADGVREPVRRVNRPPPSRDRVVLLQRLLL